MRCESASSQSRKTAGLLINAAGHVALWPALYAGAVLCCFLQLAGMWRGGSADWIAVASVICTAMGTYLIDRVKLRPILIDPADRVAQPERYAFLQHHDLPARVLAVASLASGALLAARLSQWAPLLILLSVIGTTCYAPHPRVDRARLKDLLLIKNLYTAAGLVVLAAVFSFITWLPDYQPVEWFHLLESPATLWAGLVLFVRVLLDAVLCDVDDEVADRTFTTHTLVCKIGKRRAMHLATIILLLLASAIPFLPLATTPRALWCASFLLTTLITIRTKPKSQKNFVDLRLPIEAAAISLILAMR
jgi:4-hydroxybenzoate polyprenyltransferase